MKTSEKVEGCLLLLLVGIGIWAAEIVIGLLIAWPISYIFDFHYITTALITIGFIKLITGLDGGIIRGPNEKCTECDRRIQSDKAQKCTLCGGKIEITDNEQEKYEKQQKLKD